MQRNRRLINISSKTPTILTCLGTVGVITTAIMSSKATLKANEILTHTSKNEDLTRTDVAKLILPIYIPSIIMGISTIWCIAGANILNRKNQAALMSAYTLVDNSFKEYRKKLIELHGEEIDKDVMESIARERFDYHIVGLDTPDVKVKFYEPISNQFFYAYEREIMDAEYHLNRNFVMRGYSAFNEFLEFLGLDTTNDTDTIGWSCDYGYYWIDFEHRMVRNGDDVYYQIDSIFTPDEDYLDQWE